MKVRELISKLNTYDQEAIVLLQPSKELWPIYEIEEILQFPYDIDDTEEDKSCDNQVNLLLKRW